MAYADPLDPTTPADNAVAGQGDDRIREMKRAMIQRLDSFFTGHDIDPLLPKAGSVPSNAVVGFDTLKTKLGTFFVDINASTLVPKDASIPQSAIQGGSTAPEGSTGTTALQDNSVTRPKIADDAVGPDELGDDAVETHHIKDVQVTTPKLADGAATLAKINSAVQLVVATLKVGTLALTQAQTTLGSGTYREYDVTVTGAVVGRPAGASWIASGYPSPAGPPAAGNPGWQAGDGIRLQAWCVEADKVRVRLVNLTGGSLDMGASGATLKAWTINYLDDEP